jgi:hypothetical protein
VSASQSSARSEPVRFLVPTFNFRRPLLLQPDELRLHRILYPRVWIRSLFEFIRGPQDTQVPSTTSRVCACSSMTSIYLFLAVLEFILIVFIYRRLRSQKQRTRRRSRTRKHAS